ncbi:hypothetical protein BDW66DRAFT_108690 [Aspergillus desertorum]
MSFLFNFVGKRILAESARNHFGQEDPYFEEVPASRLGRAFGKKTQKRRKAIPPGLSDNDSKVLTCVKRRAYRLDLALFNLCGLRFGWGSVIGLIPFVGDAADAALAMMVLKTCEDIDGGLPARLRMQMMLNIIIDFLIGLVPFVGDIADAAYKCNTRNAITLEKYLREKSARNISRQERTDVDPSLPDEFDRYDREAHAEHATEPQRSKSRRGQPSRSTRREDDLETGIVYSNSSRR